MKIEIKLSQIKELYRSLDLLLKHPDLFPTLIFGVKKNQELLANQVQRILASESMMYSKDYQDYEALRTSICLEYTELDVNGNPSISKQPDGQFTYDIVPEKKEAFEEHIRDLTLSHQGIIESYTNTVQEYAELLDEVVEIDYMPISLENLDKLSNLSVDVVSGLMPIISTN